MQNVVFKMLLLFCLVLVVLSSCGNKKEILSSVDTCGTINARFSADVSVIIQTSCAINNGACHGTGSLNGPGPLLNYNQVKTNAENIKAQVISRRMPLGSSLIQADIDKIRCWVEAGALNN
jgi:hypothetical protein